MAGEWYTKKYETGGPIVVPGFPRACYPPDAAAAGKTPSVPGPDCVAYKRVVSRAGRWPWQLFDDKYSNVFSHGKSSDVAETGMAGVQRQQGIDPTGWVGQKTFDLLRSIRVPDGLPHAGEMAMDAVAVDLIEEAWWIFEGKETLPPLTRKPIPSPNYSGRAGAQVRLIVLHTAEGATTIESLGAFFANPNADVSSHTGIDDQAGVIGEYVRRGEKAWTAANANPVAVQTELCAFARWTAAEWGRHPSMLENCARWIAEEAKAFSIPIVKLNASQAQGRGRGVCQHNDLGPWGGGHWDCGRGFPFDDVLKRAREL